MNQSKIEQQIEKLQSVVLEHRSSYINWWLAGAAIVLTFFGIVVAIAGYLGYSGFREIKTEAKESVGDAIHHVGEAKLHAENAKQLLQEIKRYRDLSQSYVLELDAESVHKKPKTAEQVVKEVRENPEAALTDRVLADAVLLQKLDDWEGAIERWRSIAIFAERIDNDLAARAWLSIGYLYSHYGKEMHNNTISANDQAIRLKPDFAEAYNNRGYAKSNSKQPHEAIENYDEAIRLKPDFAEAYSNRGVTKFKLKLYEDAIADYKKAIRLKPDFAKAYLNRGAAKNALEQYDDAITDYNEAIRLKPDFAEAYSNRCDTRNKLEQYKKAIADCDEAIERNPKLANAYKHRGISKLALKQKDKARQDLKTSLDLAQNVKNEKLKDEVEKLLTENFSLKVQ